MPKATVSMAPEHYALKHCPPDGYVDLRRMSFGELLASQDMAYKVSAQSQEGSDDPTVGLSVTQAAVMEYQFRICIVKHNLEDDKGQPLDFAKSPQHVHLLDPLIGQDIAKKIDLMHRLEQKYPNSEAPSVNGSSTTDVAATVAMDLPETLPTSSSA
jgi:hypothetical protein